MDHYFTAPDSRAARAALEVCEEHTEPWLRNHSLRAYSWATARAAIEDVEHDGELLYVAALLHDLALTPPFDSHTLPFEEAGGRVAKVFAAGAGWAAPRRDRLAEVIVLHMRDDVPAEVDPESHLLQVAVSADVSGRRLDEFPPDFREALLARFPRLGFASGFLARAADQADRKPDCAAAGLMRTGWAERVRNNPLDRG
ncbi:HD domain-containing protein [Saccharothrix australiensis]|uniref:HD domain-containing protein n=1 Tax=Saccharothrix australiensis TaxID=2072 RepID=A0A495W143_9PSEU|nr:HD domain-containing protein [Saccharothrix australiensis]RKT55411.1 HD domain-containing protein [Saccharothrix australiensis]